MRVTLLNLHVLSLAQQHIIYPLHTFVISTRYLENTLVSGNHIDVQMSQDSKITNMALGLGVGIS